MANHPAHTADVAARIARVARNRKIHAGEHAIVMLDAAGRQSPVSYRPINLLGDFLTQSLVELTWSGYPTIVADGATPAQEDALSRLTTQLRIPVLAKATSTVCSYAGHCGWRMIIDRRTGRPTLQLWGSRDGEWLTVEAQDDDPAHATAITCWRSRRIADNKYAAVAERFAHLTDERGRVIPGVLQTTTAHPYSADGTVGAASIPLSAVYGDDAPPDEYLYEGLTKLPVAIVSNPGLDGDGWGDSDYTQSRIDWQHEYNITQARRSFSLRLKTTPSITVDPSAANADGSLNLDSCFLQYSTPDGVRMLEITATSWDAALADSAVQIDKLREELYLITPLSPSLSGDVASAESAEARRLSLIKPKSSVADRRMMLEPALTWAYTTAMELERMDGLESEEPVGAISYLWPSAIPEELEEQQITSQTTINEVSAGLRSTDSAIARLNPSLTAAQLAEEIAKIAAAADARAEAIATNFALTPGA